jgi:hypothetical protein
MPQNGIHQSPEKLHAEFSVHSLSPAVNTKYGLTLLLAV